jgi:hypothetical protein
MAKYLEWYCVELESELKRRTTPQSAFLLVKEIRGHLVDHTEELTDGGMPLEDAERAAILELGDPICMVRNLFPARWPFRLVELFACAGLAMAAYAILYLSRKLSLQINTLEAHRVLVIVGYLSVAGVTAATWSAFKKRSFPAFKYAGVILLGCVTAISYFMVCEERFSGLEKGSEREYIAYMELAAKNAEMCHVNQEKLKSLISNYTNKSSSEKRKIEATARPIIERLSTLFQADENLVSDVMLRNDTGLVVPYDPRLASDMVNRLYHFRSRINLKRGYAARIAQYSRFGTSQAMNYDQAFEAWRATLEGNHLGQEIYRWDILSTYTRGQIANVKRMLILSQFELLCLIVRNALPFLGVLVLSLIALCKIASTLSTAVNASRARRVRIF